MIRQGPANDLFDLTIMKVYTRTKEGHVGRSDGWRSDQQQTGKMAKRRMGGKITVLYPLVLVHHRWW